MVPEVRAKANLPGLFSTSDYPAAALRADQQGTVAIDAAVDPTGRVTACAVTTSSGSVSLDVTTCSIIQRRARFTPAQDGAGRAVADRVQARIRWVLPPARPIPYADHRMALIFPIDAAGLITGCRVEASVEMPKDNRLCASTMDEARLVSTAMAKRFAVANRELVLEQGLLVGGPDRAREIGRRSGETFGEMLVLALEIRCGRGGRGLRRRLRRRERAARRPCLRGHHETQGPANGQPCGQCDAPRGALLRVLHPPDRLTLPRAGRRA